MNKCETDVMVTHSRYILAIYQHLLADIRCRLGESLVGTPGDLSMQWVLSEGPQLDKEVLMFLGEKRDSNIAFPEWLLPLWNEFLRKEDPVLLRELRQILVFAYKAEQQPTNEQLQRSQRDFEETEETVAVWATHFISGNLGSTLSTARRIVGSVIYRVDWGEIVPFHGPGGVFPSRKPWNKSCFTTYYQTIAERYPYDQYFWPFPSYWDEIMVKEAWKPLSTSNDIVANLVAVPKDSRGPRLICVHPSEAIWVQQGQRTILEQAIESCPLTRGRINFTDQSVNGKLALRSSGDQYMVTLDLKEASDRISCELVRSLFGDYAYSFLSSTRATHIKLIDGRVIQLQKFAPMGNCLTFPVQSLVFYSLVVAGIRSQYGIDCTDVYVFGDDIMFPQKYYEGAIRSLVRSGLVPNWNKTFVKGFFRESCGVDAYRGTDVTPLRLRKYDIHRLESIESLLSLAARLRQRGYEDCAAFIYKTTRKSLSDKYKVFLPYINSVEAPGLFEYVDTSVKELKKLGTKFRVNEKVQKLQLKALHLRSRMMRIRNGDWYHLMDSITRLNRKAQLGDSHSTPDTLVTPELIQEIQCGSGTEYPVPYRTRLQYGWTDLP